MFITSRSKCCSLMCVIAITTALLSVLPSYPVNSQGSPQIEPETGATTAVIPVGANFPIVQNTGQDVINGKPGIAFDGTNFLVPYFKIVTTNSVTYYNIYARRVTQQGAVLDSPSIAISVGQNESAGPPSVGFDGNNYLVVWCATRAGVSEVYGARVTPSGTVLDAGGVKITTGGNPLIRMPGIAFDGTNYLLVWRTATSNIHAARVSTAPANLDAAAGFSIASGGYSYYPSAAFDGTNYLVVWHDSRNSGVSGWDIYGARVTMAGAVLDPGGFVICDESYNQEHSTVGFDGSNYLVAWYDWRPTGDQIYGSVYGARVSPYGTVVDDPAFQIADRARGQFAPRVVCGGTDCLVIWNTDYPYVSNEFRLSDVWGRRISADGTILDPQGIPAATAFGHQFGAIAGYGNGRYLVAWSESTGRVSTGAIYGQILREQAISQPAADHDRDDLQAPAPDTTSADWTVVSAPINTYTTAGLAFSGGNSYAFGQQQALHFNGTDWQSQGMFSQGYPYGSWASGPNDIWVGGWCGGFSHFDGQQWTDLGCVGENVNAVWGSSKTDLWAATIGGGLLHYDGSTWPAVASNIPYDLSGLWGTSAGNIYAVGERGTILIYNGTSWEKQSNIPTFQRLNAIWGSKPTDIYAVGDWGTILHFNGSAWSEMESGTLQHLYGVWGIAGSEVYAVGFGGTILHYDGSTWSAENSNTSMDLLSIWGVLVGNKMTLWASGSGTQLLSRVKTFPVTQSIARSVSLYDGWVLESAEDGERGGTLDAAASLNLGDDAYDQQYRSILSFDTSALPNNALVSKVTLKIKKQGLTGTDPFNTHGNLLVDIRTGAFGGSGALQLGDFQAAASKSAVGGIPGTPLNGWYAKTWLSGIFPYINKAGVTQFRLRFAKDDNDDLGADYLKFYSGNAVNAAYRPQLVIEYFVP